MNMIIVAILALRLITLSLSAIFLDVLKGYCANIGIAVSTSLLHEYISHLENTDIHSALSILCCKRKHL